MAADQLGIAYKEYIGKSRIGRLSHIELGPMMHRPPAAPSFLRRASALIAVCLSMAALPLGGAPVDEAERADIDLRRTTLIVADIENSLRLYRDALGFKVIYDNMIRNPRSASSDDEAELARRLVFVRANDDYIGIIGLLEYTKPRKPVRQPEPKPFSTGSAVLLFTAADIDAKYAMALEVPGVVPIQPPTDVSYPAYDGGDPIKVRTSSLYDPDGFLIELTEFIAD
ncbi:MAG TPA: VOC family protein [Woeseiaceae bacterium]|nr:VOC family protein [Woeseiaceae bacterium]